MFNWPKKKPSEPDLKLRDALFGDMPWETLLALDAGILALEPYPSFGRAKRFMDSGDAGSAIAEIQSVIEMPHLESRQYLQAYHFLRALGVAVPPEEAKNVLGVVAEAGMPMGLDMIAAWADHHARYWNFSGAGVVWERPDDRLDTLIDDLLRVGGTVLQVAGPWEGIRPAPPPKGHARINVLAPSGLYLGHGPIEVLSKDRLGAPVLAAAFRLMQALMALTRK